MLRNAPRAETLRASVCRWRATPCVLMPYVCDACDTPMYGESHIREVGLAYIINKFIVVPLEDLFKLACARIADGSRRFLAGRSNEQINYSVICAMK